MKISKQNEIRLEDSLHVFYSLLNIMIVIGLIVLCKKVIESGVGGF